MIVSKEPSAIIQKFPDYCISETGTIARIYAFKNRKAGSVVKTRIGTCGYLIVGLVVGQKQITRTVHSLVAETFLGNPPTEKHEVAHNDGNRFNNHVSNLRWATRSENHADKRSHGTVLIGVKNPSAKLDENKVRKIRELKKSSLISNQTLGEMFGVSKVAIRCVLNKKTWSHV
jgi:hypothetical protein